MKTPASLLHRLKNAPDQPTWSRFVQLYLPLICHWARLVGLQDSDAADLAQEVFTLLFQKMDSFNYERNKGFRSWLRTVTLNKWRELCRRRGLPVVGNNGSLEELVSADPAKELWEKEHAAYLAARALKLMQMDFDEPTWQACWATTVEGESPADVAARLNLSVGAVYAAKSRVLRRLRMELHGLI